MRKIAKLSLVAAVAVAGLTTANAQPLEEAIKNVDISGTVVYRYDDKKVDNGAASTGNYYKVATSLKSKVTDDVTFGSRFTVNQGFGSLDTQAGADGTVSVELSEANFAYTGIANTTVMVGKQGIALPWVNAIDSDGSEQTGTGILALSSMGPVTLLGGYFNQSNISVPGDAIVTDLNGTTTTGNGSLALNGSDLMTVGAIANVGPVALKAIYLDINEVGDTYFVKASGKMGPVSAFAQYSELDVDSITTNNDFSLLKAGVSAKFGMFDAGFTYAQTGDNGSGILNNVSENSAIGYSVSLHNANNASAIFVDLGMKVLPSLHIGLNYDKVSDDDTGAADDHEETFAQFTYTHAKNLSAYVRIAQGEDGTTDYNRGRLQVEYKF